MKKLLLLEAVLSFIIKNLYCILATPLYCLDAILYASGDSAAWILQPHNNIIPSGWEFYMFHVLNPLLWIDIHLIPVVPAMPHGYIMRMVDKTLLPLKN